MDKLLGIGLLFFVNDIDKGWEVFYMIKFNFDNFKKDKGTLQREEMLKLVAEAFKQWKERESIFQNATDPDLVDYSIYQMEAARLKYIYLLKKFREEEPGGRENPEGPALNPS